MDMLRGPITTDHQPGRDVAAEGPNLQSLRRLADIRHPAVAELGGLSFLHYLPQLASDLLSAGTACIART
jgi:hypothetical protein